MTALCPGTNSPSTAVVTKIRLPQTIGDECPRPGIAVFHFMFLAAVQSEGRFFSSETPCPEGPRHCGQPGIVGAAPTVTHKTKIVKQRETISTTNSRLNSFISIPRCGSCSVAKRKHVIVRSYDNHAIGNSGTCHHHFTDWIL